MKKIALIAIFAVCAWGCHKNDIVTPIAKSFNITVLADGGTITPSGTNGIVSVPAGTNQPFFLTANSGRMLKTLTVNKVSAVPTVSKIGTSYTFTNVSSDGSIYALFSVYYTITAKAGPHGSVAPVDTTVFSDGTVLLNFLTDPGYHTDSLWENGKFIKKLFGAASYSESSKSQNDTFYVSFSNAASQSQLDSLNNILINSNTVDPYTGAWHYDTVLSKVDGDVFTWQNVFGAYPCIRDDYLQFNKGYTYLWSVNGTSCGSGGWFSSDQVGTYAFTADGQNVVLTHNGVSDTLSIVTATSKSLRLESRAAYQTRTTIDFHLSPGK